MELTGLKVGDFELQGEAQRLFIRKEISKGDYSSGYIPIQSQEYVDRLWESVSANKLEPQDYLFNYTAQKKPYTKRHNMRICKTIGKRAGISWFRSHMLRHSRARWLLDNKCAPDSVRAFLRHRDIMTTMWIYGNFTDEAHFDHISSLQKPMILYDSFSSVVKNS